MKSLIYCTQTQTHGFFDTQTTLDICSGVPVHKLYVELARMLWVVFQNLKNFHKGADDEIYKDTESIIWV